MIETFTLEGGPDAERRYLEWRDTNRTGFVLDDAPDGYRIHVASCFHLGRFNDATARYVAHTKVCALDRQELEAWAATQGKSLLGCPDCGPQQRK
jgi:hypothetical protein